jgi:putative PIN family toxin of toxin-antitoxin system
VPPIVVFDTNVLLSGVGWKGRPFKCLELARSGEVEAITCLEILSELAEKLTSKLSFATEQANDTILDLLGFLKLVSIDGTLKAVDADPDDDKVLECALAGSATFVVTGDRRHLLPLRSFHGISLVTPAEFVALVASGRQS